MGKMINTAAVRGIRRAAGVGVVTVALLAGLAPAGYAEDGGAHNKFKYVPTSYYSTPWDDGGLNAMVSGDYGTWNGSTHDDYFARFEARGEKLVLEDNLTDGRKLEAEVRVYRHADASGGPYDLIDTDRFVVGYHDNKNLGTPDGAGDISEGRYVAIRIRPQGFPWSPLAFGKA